MATVEAPVASPVEQRFQLCCISWAQYVGFSDLLGEWHVRVTYDRGRMEFMTLSPEHERTKKLLARLIETLTEELDIDIAGGGSMTCRREELERGLEPDECYWIKNERRIRGRMGIDLERDPPPDLVLEVEISRSAIDRMKLYASLEVVEVWRYDGASLRACRLDADGNYSEVAASVAFPFLRVAELERFLHQLGKKSETQTVREFRQWVRQQEARGWKPAAGGKRKR